MPILQKIRTTATSLLIWLRRLRYPGARRYWERRYAAGGRSGAGSVGVVAQFKADFLNDFVVRHHIKTVAELGCGDGDQLALAQYPNYTGLDIAPTAISLCQKRFEDDPTKHFLVYDPYYFDTDAITAELVLSLEVIFHLTEEDLYRRYMQHLFSMESRWVIVFASNTADISGGIFPHFRTRIWLPDVPRGWLLREQVVCPYQEIIPSSFFVFEKSVLPGSRFLI